MRYRPGNGVHLLGHNNACIANQQMSLQLIRGVCVWGGGGCWCKGLGREREGRLEEEEREGQDGEKGERKGKEKR